MVWSIFNGSTRCRSGYFCLVEIIQIDIVVIVIIIVVVIVVIVDSRNDIDNGVKKGHNKRQKG